MVQSNHIINILYNHLPRKCHPRVKLWTNKDFIKMLRPDLPEKCNSHAPAISASAREEASRETAPKPKIAGAQLVTLSIVTVNIKYIYNSQYITLI